MPPSATHEVRAEAVEDAKKEELRGYLEESVRDDASPFLDGMRSYAYLPQPREAVQHSIGEYVRGDVRQRWRTPIAWSRSGRC